uniref:protein-histidine N-methyltransferase n=1 Tax=Daphnia atkinsoni TaxID=342845 RepID=A0A4Y7LWM6_9CRUS|nr:EOG090X0C09 [Daphnia atkinsoni]
MFKFNFQSENQDETHATSEELKHNDKTSPEETNGQEIEISNDDLQNIKKYRENCSPTSLVRGFHLVDLKHVEDLVTSQKSGQFESLKAAIQMNSDVISGVYEGGLKIWECTLDLLDYANNESVEFVGLDVLDLGCGAGLLGMHALRKGARSVHFQDYNAEVLSLCTIPNVILNNNSDVKSKTKFFAGDWGSLHQKLNSYDIILTSETIYNPENYAKLITIFEETVKKNGVIYVAAKHFYFGVGGNIYEFEKLLRQNEKWNTSICFCSNEGHLVVLLLLDLMMKLMALNFIWWTLPEFLSIYIVHDEVKDKHFELELGWVGAVTQGRHQKVPQEVYAEVERYAKSALEDDSDSGNDDM